MARTTLLTLLPPWGRPTVPIGLGYLSQTLTTHGVQHQVLDLNLEMYRSASRLADLSHLWRPQSGEAWVDPQRFQRTLELLQPALDHAVDRLATAEATLYGFSVNQSNARITVQAAQELRKRRPDCVIVFGGLGVFIDGERAMMPSGVVDLFVLGEGEQTLLDIVQRLERGEPLQDVPGTLTTPGASTANMIPRPALDLQHHIWPTYDAFPVADYPGGGQPMPLSLSRGCVCRCSFCGDYPFWGKFRSRCGEDVVDEVEHHIQRHGVRQFEFNDLAINGDLEQLEIFCSGVIRRNLAIEWSSYAYFRKLPSHLPRLLRQAGCVMLRFGMESASDAVLERMRKPHRAQLAAQTLEQLTAAGIHCNIGLMVGFPDETDEELEQTCRFLRRNAAQIHEVDSLSVFYIKPLSEVDREPQRYGVSFPEDHRVRWNHWVGRDGSTHEVRSARARRLVQAIEACGIRFQHCNIFGL